MTDFKLAEMESRFADLIWENEPIGSSDLVRLSQEVLRWKKSTTYTVLKRLCDRGIFKNENAVVSAPVSRDMFYAQQSRRFVEDSFGGSLPRFFASFIGGQKLSGQQADELIRMIQEHNQEG